jgi:hypothetical protein
MHFLISGIPASGKSTFCRWLEETKGFLHLDVEKPGILDRNGLATIWASLFEASTSAAPFIEALEKFKRPVVIDWGFPREHLTTVRKLSEGGVMPWWFAADWAVARRKFKERGTLPMGVLKAMADFGLLVEVSRGRRELVHFRPTDRTIVFLAHDLRFAGSTDAGVVDHKDWGLFGLTN